MNKIIKILGISLLSFILILLTCSTYFVPELYAGDDNSPEYNRGKRDGIKFIVRKIAENKVFHFPTVEITNNIIIQDCLLIQHIPINIPPLVNINTENNTNPSSILIMNSTISSDTYLQD